MDRQTRAGWTIRWGVCLWWLVGWALTATGADWYVAISGSDDNPGTADRPFATVERAQQAVRRQIAAGLKEDVTVHIGAGTYFLGRPLAFGPEDSGTVDHRVTYAAWGDQRPVLSGGRPIAGWQPAGDGRWTVTVPEVAAGRWYFRELFVNGRRAVRARTPNRTAKEYCYRLVDAQLSPDLAHHVLILPPACLAEWSNLADVEVVVLKNWATLHKRIERVEVASGRVFLRGPHVKYFGGNRPRRGCGCFFENAPELLDEPGEWYLDRRTGVLTYWPREGEDMRRAEVIAPVLSHVLEIAGQPERPVRNVHFRGVAVMHHHVPLPPEGHHGRQAAFRYGADGITGGLPAIARWRFAEQCSFTDGVVAHAGGSGIEFGQGCRHSVIEGNAVFDVAGNGINVGGPNDPQRIPQGNRIANNYVHHCGRIYYGACAIWAGFAQDTVIEHNLVCHHPYTGISIGWQWNPSPTAARRYLVRYNHVYDVMREVSDGGAIYSLGYHPGTTLLANRLHDVQRGPYAIAAPNNGIFLDEGSKGYLIAENVVYRTSGKPVRHNRNQPEWHTWRDNIFIQGDLPADSRHLLERVAKAGLEPPWQAKLLGRNAER